MSVDYTALLNEFEKLVLDANDPQLPTQAGLPVVKRLNQVRAQLQRRLEEPDAADESEARLRLMEAGTAELR